jgi:hypothetical protein
MVFELHGGNLARKTFRASARLVKGYVFCYAVNVFSRNKDKPRERFYLFPGQGGRNYRAKQKRFIFWSVVAAIFFGTVLALALWWVSKPKV